MSEIEMKDLVKRYDHTEVLHGIDLRINDGEFIVLIGPSGCGKSTLLRMIAGLEDISSGELWVGSEKINEVPSQRRDFSMVFQSYALYPHLSVFENIAFGLRIRKESQAFIDQAVHSAAEVLNLTHLLQRTPKQLSGGQCQRVAMGRAIVRKPQLFLFDEPLSNLDAKLRIQMRAEMKSLHLELKTTTIYVTHDQVEAMTLADRIVVMNEGKIEQLGAPLELYDCPRNLFVAGFLGAPAISFLPGQVVEGGVELRAANTLRAGVDNQSDDRLAGEQQHRIIVPIDTRRLSIGLEVVLGIRPEFFDLQAADCEITIRLVESMGSESYIHGDLAGHPVIVKTDMRVKFLPKDRVTIGFQLENIHVFDAETELRIAL